MLMLGFSPRGFLLGVLYVVMLTIKKAFFCFLPTVRNSLCSVFPGTTAVVVGDSFQQEDNASWKHHVRAAVHQPGNVRWMMSGEDLQDDDLMIQEVPSWKGSQKHLDSCYCFISYSFLWKNSHLMVLRHRFSLYEGSCQAFLVELPARQR